jgi:hypothetical protein
MFTMLCGALITCLLPSFWGLVASKTDNILNGHAIERDAIGLRGRNSFYECSTLYILMYLLLDDVRPFG